MDYKMKGLRDLIGLAIVISIIGGIIANPREFLLFLLAVAGVLIALAGILYGIAYLLGLLEMSREKGHQSNGSDYHPEYSKKSRVRPNFPIDINSAEMKDLCCVPFIGESTAKLIVAGAPYTSLDKLKTLPGIGKGRLRQISDFLYVDPTTAESINNTEIVLQYPININTATLEQLKRIPFIGEGTARLIIENRPLKSVSDLTGLEGIGEKTLNQFSEFISTRKSRSERPRKASIKSPMKTTRRAVSETQEFKETCGVVYSFETLAPYFKDIMQLTKAELPTMLSDRLSHSRSLGRHGSYNDFYLMNMWDKHQTDVLPKKHFTYCLNYCRNRKRAKQDGELHLWLNTIRIYQNREDIIKVLERKIPAAGQKPFSFEQIDRAISVSHRFYFPSDLNLLPGYIVPLFESLILSMHPILMEVIDKFTGPMDKATLRKIVRERDKIPFSHPGRRDPERFREYSRGIPPKLRARLLKISNFRCAECGANLHETGHHIDHIIPFSRGGLTKEDNLQALCPTCNLCKGARY